MINPPFLIGSNRTPQRTDRQRQTRSMNCHVERSETSLISFASFRSSAEIIQRSFARAQDDSVRELAAMPILDALQSSAANPVRHAQNCSQVPTLDRGICGTR